MGNELSKKDLAALEKIEFEIANMPGQDDVYEILRMLVKEYSNDWSLAQAVRKLVN